MFKSIKELPVHKTGKTLRTISGQIVLVFLAFTIMVITSFLYTNKIERDHLRKEMEHEISGTQAAILLALQEPAITLNEITQTVRIMILGGESFERVSQYIDSIMQLIITDDRLTSRVTDIYGVFDAFDGQFHSGIDQILPDNCAPADQQWYTKAVEAAGKAGMTDPYIDKELDQISIIYAQRIFDDEGNPLGIVCLEALIDWIRGYADKTYASEDSYGILMDNQFRVLAHPRQAFLGRELRHMNDGPAIESEIKSGKGISERKVTDYNGNSSILFVRQLQNGWYLGIISYAKQYYRGMAKNARLLIIIGILMATALNAVLIRLAAAKNKADIASRQKTNFLAMISHEIRTPMNAILGITEIQMHNKTLPGETKEALTKIYHSGHSLLGIINDILDLSKIEAGKLELLPVNYDVASLIHDTAQLNAMRIGSKMIKFELQVDPFMPAELFGDELRIKQILNNLLSNAFKYTDSGEVVLSASAKYEDRVKTPHVSLTFQVRDTGQGMTKEQVKLLFDEYSRFNQEANRTTEGTGLGMSITRRLVIMMNGAISVESEQGKGTVFTVHLPQKNTGAPPLGKEVAENLKQFRASSISPIKTTQTVTYEPMPYGRILVVDDVETNLYVAKGLMAPYGLSIDTADSGFKAIEKIKAGSVYDIVFMDHMMPQMDGLETTKNIRSLGYTHPVIALTANAITGQAEMFMANGFDDFISKPVDIRQLNAVLNKLVRDKQPPEVIEAAKKSVMNKQASEKASQSSLDPELAKTFMRDAEKAVNALETLYEKCDSLDDNDLQMYTITTHSMKSALANVGEPELSAMAAQLEAAGRNRDTAAISSDTPALLDGLRTVIKKFTPEEDAGKTADGEPDLAFLQEKLLIFRAACVVYDKKAAKDVIIELKKKKWPPSIREFINILAEHLLHSDFEEAGNIARDFDCKPGE